MSEARAEIMARIREALKMPSPKPHLKGDSTKAAGKIWLPEVGDTKAETFALLSDNLAKLKAQFYPVENLNQAIELVKDLARKKNWKNIAYHKHELVTPIAQAIEGNSWAVDDAFTKDKLEAADVGLTSCVSIVAQFGAILVSSETSGGRGLSILPPVHVVIAKADQVVPDLAACFDQINVQFKGKMPSMLSFITGPSRTGDIERILVLGAHGPKELYLILIG
jgi:L-lactate dehydrogenase complex protein LldG